MAQIDAKLLKRCRNKDRRAQNQLYELCFGMLMPVCMRYASCEDDAMSYLNLGFYKILKNLKKYKTEIPFGAWSKRVLINTIIDELRSKKRYQNQIELRENLPAEERGFAQYDPAISGEDVYRFIQNLPPVTGSVFNLYALDGYKQVEIADMMGISVGTVKWHYAEARKRLKQMVTTFSQQQKLVS
ncbi:MAG: RNA polymerase sigma factor [Bacteroidota bacterium]